MDNYTPYVRWLACAASLHRRRGGASLALPLLHDQHGGDSPVSPPLFFSTPGAATFALPHRHDAPPRLPHESMIGAAVAPPFISSTLGAVAPLLATVPPQSQSGDDGKRGRGELMEWWHGELRVRDL
jgi:hypothetical protein